MMLKKENKGYFVEIEYQSGDPYDVLARTFFIKANDEEEAIKIALDLNPEIGVGWIKVTAKRIEFTNYDIGDVAIKNVDEEE